MSTQDKQIYPSSLPPAKHQHNIALTLRNYTFLLPSSFSELMILKDEKKIYPEFFKSKLDFFLIVKCNFALHSSDPEDWLCHLYGRHHSTASKLSGKMYLKYIKYTVHKKLHLFNYLHL